MTAHTHPSAFRAAALPARDVAIYIVVCRAADGTLYVPERDAADMGLNETIADIAGGQFERVDHVLACNPTEGWSQDVSEDVARDVVTRLAARPDYRLIDFLEHALSIAEVRASARDLAWGAT